MRKRRKGEKARDITERLNREGTLTGKENELRFAREKEKNRSNVLLRFHSQGKNRFVCR